MKRSLLAIVSLFLLSLPAWAEEVELTGQEISDILPKIIALGENTSQTFIATGSTTYIDRGRESKGRWRIQADLYCSQWPPSENWACYRVLVQRQPGKLPTTLTWIGNSGNRLVNRVMRSD